MTNRDRLRDWLDNPIFVKHVRSRLRVQPLGAAMVVVLVLCICIAWGGYQLDGFQNGGAFGVLLGLQAIILVVMGATQLGDSVGAARASGVLDFHRVSPLTPTELTIGFFFGGSDPGICSVRLHPPLFGSVPGVWHFEDSPLPAQSMILLVATAWLFQGLALLNALMAKVRANPRGVVFLLIFLILFGGYVIMIFLIRTATTFDMDQRLPFFGISLPWLAVVLLYMAAVLYVIYLAARRKMGAERIHPLSKPQSIAALVTLAVLLVGSIWRRQEYAALEVVTLYLLAITAILLVVIVTPDRAEYDKGLWRGRKQGRAHLPWWDDLALNRVFLMVGCAVVLMTPTIAASGAADPAPMGFAQQASYGSFPLAIAAGVLVVAYFGLAHQYFALRFGGRSRIYFALFLFLAWLVPLVSGMILLIASTSMPSNAERESQVIFAVSPVAGIGMTAVAGGAESYSTAIQAAAITPALLFTFVFNSLLISARRRAYKEFLVTAMAIAAAPKLSQDEDTVLRERHQKGTRGRAVSP